MTFRPSVVPEQKPDFLDTLTRSFIQARGLVEADTAAQEQRQQFRIEQEQAEFDLQRDREGRLLEAALDPRLVGPGERGFPSAAARGGGDVSGAIADQLAPSDPTGRRAPAQRRGQLAQSTTPAGDLIQIAPDMFVDPVGQEREQTAASTRIVEMLNSFAATQDDPALAAALKAKIPGIVQQIELGAVTGQAVNPAELLRDALADIRQQGAQATGNRFLLSQLPEEQQQELQANPEFAAMTPTQQSEFLEAEVQSQRQSEAIVGRRPEPRPRVPRAPRLAPGALTDSQIFDRMKEVLFSQGFDIGTATEEQKAAARTLVTGAVRDPTPEPGEQDDATLRTEGGDLLRQIQAATILQPDPPGAQETRNAQLTEAVAELAELTGTALEREISQLREDLAEAQRRRQ